MLNLAIECSGKQGSVALFDERERIAVVQLPDQLSSVQSLAPTVASLLRPGYSAQFISVTIGPGSFTGLRVGLTTAKMLAFAWSIPVVGVDTLEVIAECQMQSPILTSGQSYSEATPNMRCSTVVAVLNAFRNQVFSSAWTLQHGRVWRRHTDVQVIDAPVWQANPLANLPLTGSNIALGGNVLVTGPGLEIYNPDLRPGLSLAAEDEWKPQVQHVARLGWQAYQSGAAQTGAELLPNYVRSSAAEEKADRQAP